jgi:hypothetical protein
MTVRYGRANRYPVQRAVLCDGSIIRAFDEALPTAVPSIARI